MPAWVLGHLYSCCAQEAIEQDKTAHDHFMPYTVHGTLHLLGYDHELSDEDAEEMEALEIEILAKLDWKIHIWSGSFQYFNEYV
jgi:probable rRNA maturation factor